MTWLQYAPFFEDPIPHTPKPSMGMAKTGLGMEIASEGPSKVLKHLKHQQSQSTGNKDPRSRPSIHTFQPLKNRYPTERSCPPSD